MDERDTKTQILDAAQELIQRFGANAISYQHISEAVGIRKASIHYHFPTKEHLLEALIARYSQCFFQLVDDILTTETDVPTKLRRYMQLFEATLLEGPHDKACPCGMLGAELATLGSAAAAQIRAFYAENEQRLACLLKQGQSEGSLRFTGDPQIVAVLIFALLEGALLIVRAKGEVAQFRAITEQLLTFLSVKNL